MDGRAKRWRRTRRIAIRASLLGILVLAVFQLYVKDSWEAPLQTAAFMLELAVIFVVQLVDRARKEYELPKL